MKVRYLLYSIEQSGELQDTALCVEIDGGEHRKEFPGKFDDFFRGTVSPNDKPALGNYVNPVRKEIAEHVSRIQFGEDLVTVIIRWPDWYAEEPRPAGSG